MSIDYDSIPKPPDLPEGWSVRFIQPGEEEAVLRVLTSAFDRWPKLPLPMSPLEHLRWKMGSHPLAEKFHIVVECPDGIVGARLEWAFEVKLGDRLITLREPIDRGVIPQYQRNYALSAMRTFAQELRDKTFDMYMGYGSGAPAMRSLRRYRVPSARFSRTVDVLVCDPARAQPVPDGLSWEIRQIESFDERADALWANASDQFGFAFVRSAAHLNWRYADRRAGEYVMLVAEEGHRWLGYVVLRATPEAGYIADLLALPERNDVVESLLAAANERFRAGGQRRVECWSEPHSVFRWAQDKAGFDQLRRSVSFTCRPTLVPAAEAALLDDPTASVYITAGDTDLV